MSDSGDQTPPPYQPYGAPPAGDPGASWQGYPPAYGGYPAYGVPGGLPARSHPNATTAMVLGIVGLVGTFTCGFLVVLGPVAWYLGAKARREIDYQPAVYGGRGQAVAGLVTGIITTVLLALALIGIGVVVVLIATGNYGDV